MRAVNHALRMLGRIFWMVFGFRMITSSVLDRDHYSMAFLAGNKRIFHEEDIRVIQAPVQVVEKRQPMPDESPRLPSHVTPSHYDVTIKPRMPSIKPHFDGRVTIAMHSWETSKTLRLNAKGLNFKNVSLYETVSRQLVPIDKMEEVVSYEQVVVYLSIPLRMNVNYTLYAEYRGDMIYPFNEQGLYWDTYVDNGELKYLAATQFSPSGARSVFPCFDEPSFKATFSLSVWHQPNTIVLSNMPVKRTESSGEWLLEHFEQTPLMSTYLLATAITEFSYREHVRADGVPIRIWVRESDLDSVMYALGLVDPIMSFFENFTGIRYNLPKLDIMCTPDHPVRAMENWGMIIFQQNAILYEPEAAVASHQLEVALTLAHEICHFWLGNLVTQHWWDDLWIKEGLCTFFMYESIDAINPHWNMDEVFISRTMHSVMAIDNTYGVPPVVQDVYLPTDYKIMFNHQVYSKGACILRIIKQMIGQEVFDSAIIKLLHDNTYGTIVTSDLWQMFCDVITDNPRATSTAIDDTLAFMNSWLRQPGYPYVDATHNEQNEVELTQHLFVDRLTSSNDNDYKQMEQDYQSFTWPIPLNVTVIMADTGEVVMDLFHWMTQEHENIQLGESNMTGRTIFIANIDAMGYYRTFYDEQTWRDIIRVLRNNHRIIPVKTRARLIDDAFRLARNGYCAETLSLSVIQYLRNEEADLPWEVALSNIGYMVSIITHTDMLDNLRKMCIKLMRYKYNEVGWTIHRNESVLRRMVRREVLLRTCEFQYPPCLLHARQEFISWKNNSGYRLHPDVRWTIMCYGIQHGDVDDWFYVYNASMTLNGAVKIDYLEALACTNNATMLSWFLNVTQESGSFGVWDITQMVNTRNGKAAAWTYLQHTWTNTTQRMIHGGFLLTLVTTFTDLDDLQQLDEFIEDNPDEMFAEIYSMTKELATENIKWLQLNNASLNTWFMEKELMRASGNIHVNTQALLFAFVFAVLIGR